MQAGLEEYSGTVHLLARPRHPGKRGIGRCGARVKAVAMATKIPTTMQACPICRHLAGFRLFNKEHQK